MDAGDDLEEGGLQRATSELGERSRRRQFVIKAPHSVAMRWLLPRLSGFHRQYPDIDVKLHTAVDPPDFEREEVDAGICMGDGRWRGLVSYKLMVETSEPFGLQPQIEDVLRRYRLPFELRSCSENRLCYDTHVPLEQPTDTVTEELRKLEAAGAAAFLWERKKAA